jgi:hypothetical protein
MPARWGIVYESSGHPQFMHAWSKAKARQMAKELRKSGAKKVHVYDANKLAKKNPGRKKIRVSGKALAKTKAYITQDVNHNYVLVGEGGTRYSLSTADAIRSQKSGVPYRAPRR